MAYFPGLQHDTVALNPTLVEIQTVSRACIGLNTDGLPRGWWRVDHHMWKLGRVKRHGGLDTALLVLKRAAHQPIRIGDKISVDIVEHQGRYVSWLAQIIQSI